MTFPWRRQPPSPFDGPFDIRSVALTGLFVLALFYTLYFARAFFLPVFVALQLNFLLSPVVRALKNIYVPAAVGAALLLLALLGATAYGFYQLSGPASDWMARLPVSLRRFEAKVGSVRKPVENVRRAAEEVEKITRMDDGSGPPVVELKQPALLDTLLKGTQNFFAAAVAVVLILYFLLATEDLFLRKLIKALPGLEKVRAGEVLRNTEHQISAYLLTITVINICLGALVGFLLYLLGMPNPVLWGAMAAFLNFVPFFGPLVGVTVLTLVATLNYSDLSRILLPPAVYFGLHLIENNVSTPWILGRRLILNPVFILLWLFFWWWIWGVAGALLAVPMLATLKIFCDTIEPLAPIGEFLGR